jgi:hypothetical protein
MTTARDIIEGALRKIHQLGTGTSLNTDEANDALSVLNGMLSTYSVEGGQVWIETKETFPIVSGQQVYTIGSGGDFDTNRPLRITAAFTSSGGTDYNMTPIDEKIYSQISQKDVGSIPEVYYYDGGYPLANFYMYPVATGVSTLTIYSRKYITEFADLDATFSMPPEYRMMLEYNLAVWIAPEYEKEASRTVVNKARETKEAVQTQNTRNENDLVYIDAPSSEGTQGQSGNIYAGWYT